MLLLSPVSLYFICSLGLSSPMLILIQLLPPKEALVYLAVPLALQLAQPTRGILSPALFYYMLIQVFCFIIIALHIFTCDFSSSL